MLPGLEQRPKSQGTGGSSIPSGAVMDFAGSTAPAGWLLCAGQAVSRTTFNALFVAIGTTYGAGDGSTTFNLPDLRGRTTAGVDNMNGSAANRVTSGGSGIAGTTLGAAGGAETVTLTTAQLASHTHTGGVASGNQWSSASNPCNNDTSGNTGSAGSGNPHNNMPPAMMLNKIIKT